MIEPQEAQEDEFSQYPPIPEKATNWDKFQVAYFKLITVCDKNPGTVSYFRSDKALLNERIRHYENFRYIIHPLSGFKQRYDFFCIFFYGLIIFLKPFEAAFIIHRSKFLPSGHKDNIAIFLLICDLFCLAVTFSQFFVGYCIPQQTEVVLCPRMIFKRRLFSWVTLFSVLSSIPRMITWYLPIELYTVFHLFPFLKLIRIQTWVVAVKESSGIKSTGIIFLVIFFFLTTIVTHVMSCFHFLLPRYRYQFDGKLHPNSWMSQQQIFNRSVFTWYSMSHFRSASFMFSVAPLYVPSAPWEELVGAIISFIVGKILAIIVWIVLTTVILSTRMLRIKYEEIITELDVFNKYHRIPPALEQKMMDYYNFKYQKVFFNDRSIQNCLSKTLKREIQVALCKNLIHRVTLFSFMNPKEVRDIVGYLLPEIYLPNDVIMDYRNDQESMYFISSGTISVSTTSGKEICHLQDGAYFGEIRLIFGKCSVNARYTAIEVTKVYKLSKRHFDICFRRQNVHVFKKMKKSALGKLALFKSLDAENLKAQMQLTQYQQSIRNVRSIT